MGWEGDLNDRGFSSFLMEVFGEVRDRRLENVFGEVRNSLSY